MDYLLHIVILVEIYAALAISLDLLVGQAGMLSVCHAGFFGLGAYTASLMAQAGASFPLAMIAGMTVAVLISFIVAIPSARLRDEYFVIATFGFQMILFSVFNNWMELTSGPLGISGISQPNIFGWHVQTRLGFVVLSTLFAAIACLVVWRITSSPFGRVLRAIREDEVFVSACGKNAIYFKVTAFAVGAALAAMVGGVYAPYITYIDPSGFTVMESILVVSMVIIGGSGSFWGPLVGAAFLVALPEALRFIGLPSATAANLRQVIYGALLIVLMLFRPRGLLGHYGFKR